MLYTKNDFPVLSSIPLVEIIRQTRRIVEENPDFVYEGPADENGDNMCVYVEVTSPNEPPRPSCLIAQALHAVGVPLEELSKMDKYGEGGEETSTGILAVLEHTHGYLVYSDPAGFTDVQAHWLSFVQRAQDRNEVWRECVESADQLKPLPEGYDGR